MKTGNILILLLTAVLCTALSACGIQEQPSEASSESEIELDPTKPNGALSEILESAKEWDTDAISSFLPEGVTIEQYVPVSMHDSLAQALGRMEYSITEVTESDGKAQVQLDITAVNMESAMGEAVVKGAAYIAKQKLAGKPVRDYSELAEVVVDSIDIAGLPTTTSTATAYMLEQDDGTWELDFSDDRNLPLLNAASGGSLDLAERLMSLAREYGVALG